MSIATRTASPIGPAALRAATEAVAMDLPVPPSPVVVIDLPRVADRARETLTPSVEVPVLAADSPRSSVLIVEDEEAVRYLSRVILERAGHRVYEASTPDQAESMISDVGQVDVLVADVMLPGGRGPDLFARLRTKYPGLRVVFMSGYLDQSVNSVPGGRGPEVQGQAPHHAQQRTSHHAVIRPWAIRFASVQPAPISCS